MTRSLETITSTFSISVSEHDPGISVARMITPGRRCELSLDNIPVISGYIDGVQVSYDATQHVVEVRGRDATGDLVDCSAATKPGEWMNESLEGIITALTAPFGIPVRTVRDTGEPFRKFSIDEGETVFEAIERACRMRGILPLADGKGGLELGGPVRSQSRVRLIYGENILAGEGEVSWIDRFSEYKLLGQQPGNDFIMPGAA